MIAKSGMTGKVVAMWKALHFSLAALFMVMVAQAAEPRPNEWERWLIAKSSDGAWGYNAKSIKAGAKPGAKTVRWVQYVSTPVKNESRDWSFALSDTTFNCRAKTYTTFALLILDRDVRAIDVVTPNTEHPLPNSGALALLHKIVCQNGALKDAREVVSIETVFDELKDIAR